MQNIERRFLTATDLEVRRAKNSTDRQLVGYAIRYNSLSEDLGFRELIACGAFAESLRSDPDVRALVDHDASKIIGRTRAGTLQLVEDASGVQVTIDPPDTQLGNDLVKSVERGDLSGMSFGFRALDDAWETVDGEPVRTVRKADLYDVSVVAFPSYPDTSIAVRSLNRWKENDMSEIQTPDKKSEDKVPSPESPEAPAPKPETPEPERRSTPPQPTPRPETADKRDPGEWRDVRSGKEVRVLNPDQKFADLHPERLSLGGDPGDDRR